MAKAANVLSDQRKDRKSQRIDAPLGSRPEMAPTLPHQNNYNAPTKLVIAMKDVLLSETTPQSPGCLSAVVGGLARDHTELRELMPRRGQGLASMRHGEGAKRKTQAESSRRGGTNDVNSLDIIQVQVW